MNEPIKELAGQCWDARLDGVHFDQEKFAELIVDETCHLLMEMHKDANGNHNYYHHAAVRLKEHFGVE